METNHDWLLCHAKLVYQGNLMSEKIHTMPLDGLFEFARYVILLHENDTNYISYDGLTMYDDCIAEFDENGNLTNECQAIIDANSTQSIYKVDNWIFEAIKEIENEEI